MINKLAVLDRRGEFKIHSQPMANLKSGFARIKVAFCGLCGTDLSYFRGEREVEYPKSLGHEISGSVLLSNSGVVEIGQGVVTDLNYRCGECDYCTAQRSHLCESGKIERFSNRGFAKYIDIDPQYLYPIDNIAQPQLALAEPLSCGLHAVELAEAEGSGTVLVVGAGGMGMMAATAMWLCFPNKKFKVVDPVRWRARRLSQAIPSASTSEDPSRFDLVFETSGSISGLRDACDYVKKGGKLCIISHYESGLVDFLDKKLARNEVMVIFSYQNGTQKNMLQAIRFLCSGWSAQMNNLIEVLPVTLIQEVASNHTNKAANKIIFDVGFCL